MNQTETAPLLTENKKAGRWLRKYGYLLLCMIVPAVVMYLIYFAREIYPIGDGSVLVLDLNGQYVWFFEALRNFVKGDASLLYSFSRAMGGEFLGIYAYYISSPLSYLLALFPKDRMLEGLLFLFLLKTALCGGSFGLYMHRTSKKPNKTAIIVFATCYALSAYGIVQQHNTMWIDAMMWLPMITLGMESLIKKGKFKLYTVSLAVTLFSNFYIGYMVCIYCFFYFFLCYFGHSEERENNPDGERLHFLRSGLRVAFYSLLAVGMAAVILLGAYYSLSFGKSTFSNTKWVWSFNFDIIDLLFKFLPSSYDTVRPAGYPFVYCGVLTLLLIPSYFLSRRYPMRQKIAAALFVFLFVASFSLSVPDLLWHGFQRPNWLNYRYSFMLCFILTVLACRAMNEFDSVSLKAVAGTGGLLALICVILQNYTDPDNEYMKPNDYTCIWFSLIVIAVWLAVLGLWRARKDRQVISVVMVAVVAIECFLNGLWCMNALDDDVVYSKYSYYNNYLNKTRPIVEMVQGQDKTFYRMEKTMFRKLNDNMALNIRGLSGSTSTLNQETIKFLDKMGYSSASHWSKYLGGTPVNDSLLGLKYIISDTGSPTHESWYEAFVSDPDNRYTAYYNRYALSLAYGVSDDLLDFALGYKPVEKKEETKKDNKDTDKKKPEDASIIGSAIDRLKAFINGKLGIDETVRSAEYTDPYYSPFTRLNAMIAAMLGEEQAEIFKPLTVTESTSGLGTSYPAEKHTCYSSVSASGVLTYKFTVPEDGEVYFYLPTKYPRELTLTLWNETQNKSANCGKWGTGENLRIVSLGVHHAGDVLTLRANTTGKSLYYVKGEPAIAMIDRDAFTDAFARLGQDQFRIDDYTEHSFRGKLTTSRSNELILTTLAYDQGWRITVDGKAAEPVKALGSLVAFRVEGDAGEHEIRLEYRPRTLVLGLWVSGISTLIFLALVALSPILRKTPGLRGLVTTVGRKKKNEAAEGTDTEAENPAVTESTAVTTEITAAEPSNAAPEETQPRQKGLLRSAADAAVGAGCLAVCAISALFGRNRKSGQ